VNAFQDAKLNVHHEIATEEWVVQEFVFEGTHTGTLSTPAGEIPPTNRTLRGRGVQIFRVDGGTVTDTRLYFDQVQVMSQLGLMPESAAATS
jgi:predicted ester cyclase